MQPLLTDYLVVWASSELLQSWGQEFFLNERCTNFTRTIGRVQFLFNWDVMFQVVYLLRIPLFMRV